MATAVIMPELGESIVEGTIVRWLKQAGEQVQEDEPIVEIMTDKVNTELPAPASGILKQLLAAEGDTVQVGQELALIESANGVDTAQPAVSTAGGPPPVPETVGFYTADESSSPPSTASTTAATATSATLASPPTNGDLGNAERRLTPLVRRMIQENNISAVELSQIHGTGTGGRITKYDIQQLIANRSSVRITAPAAVSPAPTLPAEATHTPLAAITGEEEIIPLAGMRKVIADHLTHSYHTAVHVTTVMQVDVSKLVEFRERNKESFQQQHGVRLTYTPFFVKATAEALIVFPMMNAFMIDDKIIVKKYVHMGVAVALGEKGDEGLIVPAIRDVHKKSLIEIARDLEDIAKRARSKSITVADVQGATFTITNTGSYGALIGTPIINHPQTAILGTYAIVKTPVVINDMLAIRPIMHLCLSYDHRLIDGMYAGKFLQKLKGTIENFEFFK
jgi:pyruvate dehydrogenase E2 component (dihydrolipoamide acetyltransferase)